MGRIYSQLLLRDSQDGWVAVVGWERKLERREVLHDSSFGKSIEDSTDISSSSTRVTFHDTAVLHYDDGRSPTSAAATKRNTLRCRPILFPPPRFYLAGENDDAMKWHEKARYPFQLPQTLFEGTTCTQISNDVPTKMKMIRDGAHYRFFPTSSYFFWGSSSNSLFVIGTRIRIRLC